VALNPVQLGEHHIIGPDTEILGGVYFRNGATVVDFAENPQPYELAYEKLEGTLTDAIEGSVLFMGHAIDDVVKDTIVFSEIITGMILKAEAESLGLERVDDRHALALSTFIETGGGVCHHQGLLGGAMVRLLQQRRGLGGKISFDYGPTPINPGHAKHSWLRYVRDREGVIIDFARNRVIPFNDASPLVIGEYRRPEERQRARAAAS